MIIYTIGTRAHTDETTQYHQKHTCLMLIVKDYPLLIDAGEGIKKSDINPYIPKAILITHAHEDHIGPVLEELDAPIYTTAFTINMIKDRFDIPDDRLHIIEPDKSFTIGPYTITAYKVVHSIKAPAVGYYIEVEDKRIWISPDFLFFPQTKKIPPIDIWVGDGSSPFRRIVRAANLKKVGHASMIDQIKLAISLGAKLIIFIHIGKNVMEEGDDNIKKRLQSMFPDIRIILARDNMQINTDEQFIKDPDDYHPEKLPNDVLADDWRIINGWYATMRRKNTKTIGKVNEEQLLHIAASIYAEMIKRGFKFHPEEWKPYTKELVKKIRKLLPDIVKSKINELDTSDIMRLVGESDINTRIYLPELIGMFKTVETDSPQILLIGGLVNRGWSDSDIDILILSKYKLPVIEELIMQTLPPNLRDRIHIIYRDPALPKQYLGNYIPLYNIALVKNDIEVNYSELDKLKPFDRFKPMKSLKGYHAAEYYDPVDLYQYWAKQYIDAGRPIRIDPKYDGIRGVIEKKSNKVEIFTEDTMQDISWRLPTLTEQIKKIPHDFILDCELIEWEPNFIKPRPREEMTWFATSKTVPEDREKWVKANIFDVLYWDGKDLTSLPLSERQTYFKYIPESKNIRITPYKIIRSKADLWKYVAWAKDNFPESEGAMLKVLDSPYLAGKKNTPRTPLWAKIKRAVEIDVIVLEKHVVTKNDKLTGAYNYIAGLAIPKKRLNVLNPKDIVDYKSKKYYRIGKTYNTNINAKVGQILTIIPVYISVKKMKNGKLKIRWMNPSVEHIKIGKKQPDDVDFAISRASLIESMGDNESLDDFILHMQLGDKIELSQPWVIDMLPPCPYVYTDKCFLINPDPDKLSILKEELLLHHVCPYAQQYKCPLIKDYFYVMKLIGDIEDDNEDDK